MLSTSFQVRIGDNIKYWDEKVKNATPANQVQLNNEHPNLQRALEFGLAVKTTRTDALGLALDIFPLLDGEASDPIWFTIYEKAIATGKDQTKKARLLNQLGFLYSQARKGEASLDAHKKAEAIGKETQLHTIIARAHLGKSQSYWLLDRIVASVVYAEKALERFKDLEEEPALTEDMALAHNALGLALHSQVKYRQAQNEFRKALVLTKSSTKTVLRARLHNNRAFSFQEDGLQKIDSSSVESTRSLEKAIGHFSEAITIYKGLGKVKQLARVELSRCNLHIRLGNHLEAEKALQKLRTASSKWAADFDLQAQVAYNLGQLNFSRIHWYEAQAHFENALYLWGQADNELMQAQISIALSDVYYRQGNLEEQKTQLIKAQGFLEELPDQPLRNRLLLEVETKLGTLTN